VSNLNLTLINFLLDRSGSMQSIKSDVVGGFDAFLTDQRAGEGECRVTLAQFDNVYEVVYHAVPVADVPPGAASAQQHRAAGLDGPADHRHGG